MLIEPRIDAPVTRVPTQQQNNIHPVRSAAGLKVRVEIHFKKEDLLDVHVWSAMQSLFADRFIPVTLYTDNPCRLHLLSISLHMRVTLAIPAHSKPVRAIVRMFR